MRESEKDLIKKAIRLIHNDNEYYEGMNILAKLVGWEPADPMMGSTKTFDVAKFMASQKEDET